MEEKGIGITHLVVILKCDFVIPDPSDALKAVSQSRGLIIESLLAPFNSPLSMDTAFQTSKDASD